MNLKNILIISGVYITTIIGAGFASGREIVDYFVKYGNISLIGIVGVSIFFAIALYAVLYRCRKSGIDDFSEYLRICAGERYIPFFNVLITVFMLCVFAAMIACSAQMLSDIFKIEERYTAFIISIFCFVCFCFDIRGISAVNTALAPVIIIGITGICLYILNFRETAVFLNNAGKLADNLAVSALGYTSYNILTSVVIMTDMAKLADTQKDAKYAGIISGVSFFVMMILLWGVIKIYYGKIELGDIPMLTIAAREGNLLKTAYIWILLFSVITTAISNGFGVIGRICKGFKINGYICNMLVCMSGFLISGMGFSDLVSKVYKICGIAGIAILIIIIKDYLKILKKSDKLRYLKKKRDINE